MKTFGVSEEAWPEFLESRILGVAEDAKKDQAKGNKSSPNRNQTETVFIFLDHQM